MPGDVVFANQIEKEVGKADVYQVIMPTSTDEIFNFILGPQGLINATDGAAYEGKTFEENSTVFFKRTDGKESVDYSSKSDFVTITNMSSIPVDVSVKVSVVESSVEGVTMTDDRTFTNDEETSLYLAITDEEKEVCVDKNGTTIHATIDAAPDGAYEHIYDEETGKYFYKLKDDLSGFQFNEYSFQLTGAANMKGDWMTVGKVSPKIIVTWKVTEGKSISERKKDVIDMGKINLSGEEERKKEKENEEESPKEEKNKQMVFEKKDDIEDSEEKCTTEVIDNEMESDDEVK